MKCRTLPFFEFAPGIFEIDEFDGASIFVIEGTERALLIDVGTGIGDLKWVVENRITDKPYEVVVTHNHGDHIGGAGWFHEIWIHPDDMDLTNNSTGPALEFRKKYAEYVQQTEKKNYAYNIDKDILEWPSSPKLLPLQDGQVFELGGRKVTAIHCPGHTAGEMVFIDDKTRTLLAGDSCNCNFILSNTAVPFGMQQVQVALQGLERIESMRDQYDKIYNSHHDFRGFGSPLADNVLPDLITCLRRLNNRTASFKEIPDPWGTVRGYDVPENVVAYYNDVYISLYDRSISDLYNET